MVYTASKKRATPSARITSVLERPGRVPDALHLETDDRQAIGDLVERGGRVQVVPEPVEREFHERFSQ
jgi:hypothetical protein